MKVAYSEPARGPKNKIDPTCEIRIGVASWDDGSNTAKSVNFTWFTSNGRAARGGEVPVEGVPQMVTFAIQKGYLALASSP